MEWTLTTFLLANFILIVASILQMATGVSVGMIIVPFLAMISYTLIPVPVVFASLTLTIMMAYKGREHIDIENVPQVSLGMLAGIFVALYIFKNSDVEHLGIIFGLFILLSVFISLKVKSFKLGAGINYGGGFVAGLMGAVAAVGGQILALIFQNHPLESIKSTLAFLYTIFTLVMLILFYLFDAFSYDQLISGLYMMPGFMIGYVIAPMFTEYFNPKYAKSVVLGMATFGALALIAKGVLG
ncbi:sulfite exporter TauE/SafE family protein [Sulfurovum sp.]|uniref:sulfite exporter TauE/SafE family protein n=1 Tax=Sulfurovum sp. TaxID=1969726 RepID=UPI0025EF0A1F|nr:sulfite exporter TauE/SafE family protein [Sulfurovum sp.]